MHRLRYLVQAVGVIAVLGLAVATLPAAPLRAGFSIQSPPPQTQPPAKPDAAAASAGAAQKPQPPTFKTGVNVVRVDVIVTDRQGSPLTDLTQADFEVLEDGKPQPIDLFRMVNSDGRPGPGAEPARAIRSLSDEELEAAREDVRLFVIFLDDYHVRITNGMRVRDPLVQFLRTQLGPLDMVAIMYPLTPVTSLTFSRDREALVNEVRKFEGRKFNYTPRNVFEQQYAYAPAQVVETMRNQITISALKGLPVRLGSLREGRKAVILVSEGFIGLLPEQMRSDMADAPGTTPTTTPARRRPTVLTAPGTTSEAEDRNRFYSDNDIQQELRDVYDAANRNNTAIYALDPRGLATGEFEMRENINQQLDQEILRSTQSTLRDLANNTDGRALINRNDLDGGLKQVVRDTSSYYLVGYNSPATKPDGKYHQIDVRVKRPGAQVRARKGYWAPTAAEAAAASAPPRPRPPAAVERALSTVEARPGSNVIAAWLGTAQGTDGKTRVVYAWEPMAAVPGDKRQAASAVNLVVTGASGEQIFRGRAASAPAAAAPAQAGGMPATVARPGGVVSFDVRPGKMSLRVEVLDAAGHVIDDLRQEHQIPDFSASKAMLSTPLVLVARTPREFQALSRDPEPVPTATRQFRRTDRLLIRFVASAPGAGPTVTIRLLNRAGQKMSDLSATTPDGAGYAQIDLPLAGLSPGEYLVEVKAAGGGSEATELVPIRIGG